MIFMLFSQKDDGSHTVEHEGKHLITPFMGFSMQNIIKKLD